jgi:hypothetical protein
MLGEQRQLNENLMREIQGLKTSTQTTQDNYEYGEPIDIRSAIRNELRTFYQEDILKPQTEYNNRIYGELAEIQQDDDFNLVKGAWDEHLRNAATQQRINTGQTTPKAEYDRLIRTFYRQSLKKTRDALQGIVDVKGKPPHVETGDQTYVHTPTQSEETTEQVKNIVKNSRGGDSDIDALVKTILPADDPIFKKR